MASIYITYNKNVIQALVIESCVEKGENLR